MSQKLNKFQLIEEKRRKYENSKMVEDTFRNETRQQQTMIPSSQSQQTQSKPSSGASPSSMNNLTSSSSSAPLNGSNTRDLVNTDKILQQITQKLTSHIREEIIKEQINQSLQEKDVCTMIVSRIEDFVSNELSNFTCPICYETMVAPDHLPMLLFPCGHTFCDKCINQRSNPKASAMKTCPYCRYLVLCSFFNMDFKSISSYN